MEKIYLFILFNKKIIALLSVKANIYFADTQGEGSVNFLKSDLFYLNLSLSGQRQKQIACP